MYFNSFVQYIQVQFAFDTLFELIIIASLL